MMNKTILGPAPLLAMLILLVGLIGIIPDSTAADPAEDQPKAAACAECHEDVVKTFEKGVHHSIDVQNLAFKAGAKFSCESCHGNVAQHLENPEAGNIFSFKAVKSAPDKAKMCLACHQEGKMNYFAGPHGKAAMDCSSCHNIHGAQDEKLIKGGASANSCASCHQDIMAKFKLNEKHRLKEGVLKCENCHDPHKPAMAERLGGFRQETCFKCHADKQGPFLYEHQSITVEGCTVCHDAHGSVNRHMLINQSVSELCYTCHTTAPVWHSRFTPDSNCVNCHSTIHGSNLSPKFLK